MKKLFLTLQLLAALMFVGCSDDPQTPEPGPKPEPQPQPAADAIVKVSEVEATAESISFKVESQNAVQVKYLIVDDKATTTAEHVMQSGVAIEIGESIVILEAEPNTTYTIYAAAANSDNKLTLSEPLTITTPEPEPEPTPDPTPDPTPSESILFTLDNLAIDTEGLAEGKLWLKGSSSDGSKSVKLLIANVEPYLNGHFALLSNVSQGSAVNYIDYTAAGNVELTYEGETYTEFIADSDEQASYMTAETLMPSNDSNAITIVLNTADKSKSFTCEYSGSLYGGAAEIEETVRDLSAQLHEFVHNYKDGKHYLYFESITINAMLVLLDADNDGVLGAGESTNRGYEMYSVGDGIVVEECYYSETVDGVMSFNFTAGTIAIKSNGNNDYTISLAGLKGKCTTQPDLYVKYTSPESGWDIKCIGINGTRDEELYIDSLTVTPNTNSDTHNLYFRQTNFNMLEFKQVHGYEEGVAKTYYIASSLEKAKEIGGESVDCWIDGKKIQFWTMIYAFDDLRVDMGDYLKLDEDGTWHFSGTSTDGTKRFTFTFKP